MRSLSVSDLERVRSHGSNPQAVTRQLELLRRSCRYVDLLRACKVGDGIIRVDTAEGRRLAAAFDDNLGERTVCKFVPASGAASRMFKALGAYLADPGTPANAEVRDVLGGIDRFAFADDLKAAGAQAGGDGRHILALLLDEHGLDYASLPKALLKFHRYPQGGRTAIEEHLVETAYYARDRADCCRLHFTVSREHRASVLHQLESCVPIFEQRFGVRYKIDLSEQNPGTDSVAVDSEGKLFRDEAGRLLFRPAGHGALIENVADIDADVVFIKNIDNVVPESLVGETVFWKKVLGGLLIELQTGCFEHVRLLEDANAGPEVLEDAARFLRTEIGVEVDAALASVDPVNYWSALVKTLDRPLRVCGMVRNTGEPGGGPFWVQGRVGPEHKQIVETSEIDLRHTGQKSILSSATHFNPVDLVCTLRDRHGNRFDLRRYVDSDAVFIVEKSYQDGRSLRSVELPGLWNGAMAGWNTVFVEVPIETFNPVKQLGDLLRPAHQGDQSSD